MKRTKTPPKNDKPTKKAKTEKKPEANLKDATSMVEEMTITLTGAREGEVLFGIRPATKDCVMVLSKATVPPKTQDLDTVRAFPDLWNKFIKNLSVIEFFSGKSNAEREDWLTTNQSEKDVDISEVEGSEIEVE